ncbi:hypothetical protein Y032_0112g287 [Ancylostoma ceylanicum]|uniref:Uncharacterized protein n=1 Tax=Ancylostoma ceylanicum TaxID=53326 RepID=A0A016TCX5_9BILA|nr:hypothetical protein Y032_0112g287 [Ancylostoma ceylanicum]
MGGSDAGNLRSHDSQVGSRHLLNASALRSSNSKEFSTVVAYGRPPCVRVANHLPKTPSIGYISQRFARHGLRLH